MSLRIPSDWSFERHDVADAFDAHVREQLPWYDLATGALCHVARHYIPASGLVYDIGASTGNIGRALSPILSARSARLVAIDSSAEMVTRYAAPGHAVCADATEYDFEPFDVAVLFLTLMFVPVAKRRALIIKLKEKMRHGGAIIVFDKSPTAMGYSATVMWRLALAGKVAQKVCSDEIIAKELSLAGVQRPLDAHTLGHSVEFFRFGDFAGWLIEG